MNLKSLLRAALAGGAILAAGCATAKPKPADLNPPTPDPRVGLKAGWFDAQQAAWNMKLVSTTPPSSAFMNKSTPGDFRLMNSDIGFTGHYAIQGNFSGYQVWDVADPLHPKLYTAYVCPGSQSDVSVYKNLMFVSGEATNGRHRLRHAGRRRHGEPRAAPRHPHLRHHRHRASEAHHRRADLPRLAHAHGGDRSEGHGEHLHLRLRLGAGALAERARGLLGRRAGRGLDVGALPDRGDPGAARGAADGAHRQLTAHLQRPRRARRRTARRRRTRCSAKQRIAAYLKANPGVARQRRRAGEADRTDAVSRHHRVSGDRARRRRLRRLRAAARHPRRRRIPSASAPPPIRTSPTGTRPPSTTTAARCSSRTSGGADCSRAAASTDKYEWGADAIFTLANDKMSFKGYYKMPAPQTTHGELRRAQRVAHPDPGPRHHGAGVVPGGRIGVRVHRRRAPEGDRVLRPRSDGLDEAPGRGFLVGVLVQRLHLQLRDRARARHLRADGERLDLAERARRGEDGALRLLERAGAAEARLAGVVRAGTGVPRPARARERARRGSISRMRATPSRRRRRRPAPRGTTSSSCSPVSSTATR